MLSDSSSVGRRVWLQEQFQRAFRFVNERPRLCLGVLALFLLLQIRPWWIPQPDSRSYLSMARSVVVEGRMLNLGHEHLWYFPGYPLLLSPAYLVSEQPFWLISAFQWVAAALLMLGVYKWARDVAPEWAIWIAALSGVNAGVWFHAARALSEVPFMCGLIWSANAGLAACRSRSLGRMMLFATAASLLMLVTALIRPAALMLAIGFGLSLGWQALRGRTSWVRAVAITLLVGVPASIGVAAFMRSEQATASQENARTYLSNFGDSARSPLESYIEGLRLAIRDSGRVVVPGMFKAYQERGWTDINLIIYVPVCLVLGWGWWRAARGTGDPLLLGVPAYVFLHIVYPYEAGARFFVPLFPIFLVGLAWLVGALRPSRAFAVATFCAAHMLIAVIYWLAVDAPRAHAETRRWAEMVEIAQQIDAREPHVALIGLSGNERLMLELELDRHIAYRKVGSAQPDDEWLISDVRSVPGGSYRVERTTQTLALSHRAPVDSARQRAPVAQ